MGTSVGNPVMPKESVSPDFEAAIPERALGAPESTSAARASSVAMATSGEATPTGPAAEWEAIVLNGGFEDARVQRQNFEDFGEALWDAVSAASITDVTAVPRTVVLNEATLIATTAVWEVELMQETTDSNFIRLYFTNQSTGLIQGTYLVASDASGKVIRGLMAYIDPETLSEDAKAGKRLVALAFDFSDPADSRLLMRVDHYTLGDSGELGAYVYHVHYQCNSLAETCTGEYLDIQSPEPERDFGDHNIRLSWDDQSSEICTAYVSYDDVISIGDTQAFIGPETPSADEIETNLCLLPQPVWGGHLFTEGDLPARFLDDDAGGTAGRYFLDGFDKAGWDALTPELIDTWLDASAFE